MSFSRARARVRTRVTLLAGAALLALALASGHAVGATSSVVVTATVPSATNLTTSGCATGSSSTSFGVVLPGTSNVTTADCSITFGSSNDTAMLLAHQVDGLGAGMWLPPSGPLDTANFGGSSCPCTGTVVKAIDATRNDTATAMAVQPDGKVVVVGYRNLGGTDNAWFVTRFNADGTSDAGFATGGTYALNPTANDDRASAVAVLPSGDIAVGGGTNFTNDPTPSTATVLELTPAGAPDPAFNGTGSATVSAGGTSGAQYVATMAAMPGGDITISGAPAGREVGVVELQADGTLDPNFDGQSGMPGSAPYPGNGKVVFDYFDGCGYTYTSLAQPDGKLLVAGQGCAPSSAAAVLRLNVDGSLDTTFNGTGKLNVNWGAGAHVTALAVQPDGKVLLAGPGGSSEVHVLRVSATGTPDPTFGTAGTAAFNIGTGTVGLPCQTLVGSTPTGAGACALALLPDGRIEVGGVASISGGTAIGFARLTSAGALDPSFGTNGVQLQQVNGATKSDTAHAMAITQDGRLLAAGSSYTAATKDDVALVQLASTPVADWNAASATWSLGTNAFGVCLASVASGATTSTGPTPAATWQVNAGCPTSGAWNALPPTAGAAGAKVAQSTTSTTQVAQANLRFGLRTGAAQKPGSYLAPVEFDVVAPNV